MHEQLERFLSAQREFGARVHAVTEDQWDAPTPDSEWTVADLVSHLVDEHRWAAPLLHGLDLDSAGKVVDGTRDLPVDGGVGANLAEAWDEAATGSADAFTAEGALDRRVALSRGSTPVGTYIDEMTFDLTVHSWDLARAIGYADALPDDLVSYVLDRTGSDLSGSELFAPARDVAGDAPPIDRLVAATGRDPGWSAG
jgi:uncharacterized protein (TIGR03086 family)